MENNNYNPLEAGMKSASQNEKTNATNKINDKVQYTHAEDTLAKVASVLFWVSTIGYSVTFMAGVIMMMRGASVSDYTNEAKYSTIGLIATIASVIFYLINLIAWAKLKVTVNISRNLFVIKGLMLEDKEKNSSKEENSDTE